MTMEPTGAGRGIPSARRPGMWEVNNRWLYDFPACMGNILKQQRVQALLFGKFLLLGDHDCAMPRHRHCLQKRLLLPL